MGNYSVWGELRYYEENEEWLRRYHGNKNYERRLRQLKTDAYLEATIFILEIAFGLWLFSLYMA